MFDVIAGAKVAAAEYLLTGCLGWCSSSCCCSPLPRVVGFMWAYLIAGGAITGLLTAYSAAVLKSWMRARFIGGLLVGLYATLYVLLNLEAYSLIIGSLLLFRSRWQWSCGQRVPLTGVQNAKLLKEGVSERQPPT